MKVGFGSAPITPTPPVHLAGFGGRLEPVTKVHDDLEARAIALSSGDTSLVLVVCDLLGMSPAYSRPVREAVAAAAGIGIDHVLVSCTHTHQGPSVMTGTDALGWPNPPGYEEILQRGCVDAATQATASATDARLRYGRSVLPDHFAFNRRGEAFEEPWFATLDVLGADGSRAGVVANMHIHPVLLGPHWDAVATDWVGPFRREIERLAGGIAIELTGALGDINPTPPEGTPGDSYEPWASAEQTDDYGRRLADVVAATLDDAQPVEPSLELLRAESHEIAVGTTPIAALQGTPTMLVEFIEWALGDVRVVSIPGEAFHQLGREISSGRDDRVLLAGIAPAWHGYLPVPWGSGERAGYEEGVSFGEEAVAAMRSVLVERPAG